jgi:hypothetical protein
MSPADQKFFDISGKIAFGLILAAWFAFGLYALHIDGKL